MTCEGHGDESCPTCHGEHVEKFVGCPLEQITPDVLRLRKFAGYAKDGTWPLAGGVLDQAQVFVDAAEYLWDLDRQFENKRTAAALRGDDETM